MDFRTKKLKKQSDYNQYLDYEHETTRENSIENSGIENYSEEYNQNGMDNDNWNESPEYIQDNQEYTVGYQEFDQPSNYYDEENYYSHPSSDDHLQDELNDTYSYEDKEEIYPSRSEYFKQQSDEMITENESEMFDEWEKAPIDGKRAKYSAKIDRFLTNGIIVVGVLLIAILLIAFLV